MKRYEGVVMDHGLGITKACMAMTSFSDAPAADSGLTAVGEIRLMPDISTRRRLPWYVLTLFHSPCSHCYMHSVLLSLNPFSATFGAHNVQNHMNKF